MKYISIHQWIKGEFCYDKIEVSVENRCEDKNDRWNKYDTKYLQQKNHKLLVSNTDLRYIIVINITQFTPGYKKMCGSGVCIQSTQL